MLPEIQDRCSLQSLTQVLPLRVHIVGRTTLASFTLELIGTFEQ